MKFLILFLFSVAAIAQLPTHCDTIFPKNSSRPDINNQRTLAEAKEQCPETILENLFDDFRKARKAIHINFDDGVICKVSDEKFKNLVSSGYQEVESNFTSSSVSLFVKIRWKKHKFQIDPRYNGAFHLKPNPNIQFINDSHQTIETLSGISMQYSNRWITLNGIHYNSDVAVSKMSSSKVGIAFLKGFNWIIDFDRRKVYFKKNLVGLESTKANDYGVTILKGKLVIGARNTKCTKYQIGEIIESIENEKVTSDNICRFQKLLSDTKDWNELQIETTPVN